MKSNNLFPLERNNYFYGKLLTVTDFELEQTYFNNKRRLINKAIHGAGVVCGLGVSKVDDFTMLIESCLALDYQGREIVMESSIVRKLQMIEGYESVMNSRKAYLCLRYAENDNEQVSALVSGVQKTQSNKVQESYKIYLDSQQPDIKSILEAGGEQNINILYQSSDTIVAFSMPVAVLSGQDFTAKLTVIKSNLNDPISIGMKFKSKFITDADGSDVIKIVLKENPYEQKQIWTVPIKLKAASLNDCLVDLCEGNAEFRIVCGDKNEALKIPINAKAQICKTTEDINSYLSKNDNLMMKINGIDMPIYLAKVEIIPNQSQTMVGQVFSLPFLQKLKRNESVSNIGGPSGLTVSSEVEILNSWQKPEAQAMYNQATSALHFKFSLPTNQEYDFTTSSGIIEIPMSTGMRVNARYVSSEVAHNLGVGNVDIKVWVEYNENDEKICFSGNREVFRDRTIPQIQTAIISYPERGTFKVGVWLLDNVEGSIIRIRYFASKAKKDLNEMIKTDKVVIKVVPEVRIVKTHERVHLKASINGSSEKGVIWQVKDKDGGSIDQDGLYQAPDVIGTYEIIAKSKADPSAMVSTFVIVEG